ncbi:MAG TPA: ATP-binding protein [Prolixibacteraceae bacterium]|jgi:PAS domain S-box-containing protein
MLKILTINDNLYSLTALIKEAFPDSLLDTAFNGQRGIELAIAKDPDVIFLDGMMPEMDGLDICRQLKQNIQVQDIPVVFLTAHKEDKVNRMKALQLGAEGFLNQPIDAPELIALINAMVKIKSANRQKYAVKELPALVINSHDITERKLADEDLQLALRQLEFHENNSPLAVIEFNHTYQITKWSKKAENIFGWRADEVLGKSIDEFRWVHKDDTERVTALMEDMLGSKKRSNSHTNRNYRKNGSVITCEWYNSALIDSKGSLISVHSLVLDITKRTEAEKALSQSNEFNKYLLHTIPFAMDIVDENGNILFINEKLEMETGMDVIGKKCWSLYRDDKTKCINCPMIFGVETGVTKIIETQDVFGGKTFQISHTGMIFHGKKAVLEIFQDITARRQIESELIKAKEKAEENDLLKTSFLANMSHEIRTPLNSIIGFSELLTDPDYDPSRQFHIARMIYFSGNNLLTIINNILEISEIETGQVHVTKERFNVNQLIFKVQKEFLFKSIEKGIELSLDPSNPDKNVFMEGDQVKTSRILGNFVNNALKFTKMGSITIGFKTTGDFIQFSVEDTGIGIPEQYHSQVFERFRQVEPANTRKYGGNGLGLAISRGLVEILGGRIWMESKEGKGSTFYFTIPIR